MPYDNYKKATDEALKRHESDCKNPVVKVPGDWCVFGYGGSLVVADVESFVTEMAFGQPVHEGRIIPVFFSSTTKYGREDLANQWLRQERYKGDIRDRPEVVASILSKFVNNLPSNSPLDEVADLIVRDDRCLQQCVFRLFLRCIRRWAMLTPRETDLQNETTVRMCKKISTMTENDGLPYI